ncbi:Asp23/Gls24 family envelope stress response protein [Butyrivibrio sp. VCD2006]|uniref:Asp23/Gls24 family envelope stress response protein n=1 Tax=Butyrivibrio sp. VCD2006 TaxID=1280664 RepID=UPI00042703F5|nr:Asp23/Gls24 family envelope stress response protein [Butyrivibrio sp. VCD2006]
MEKEVQNNTLIKAKGIGSVKIADDVVAKIAALAALEIDGVSAMAGNYTSENIEKAGPKNLQKSSRIFLNDGKVRVDMSILMDYSYNIPATSKQVQDKVKSSIESMTGLNVTDVNVRIAGIKMPD